MAFRCALSIGPSRRWAVIRRSCIGSNSVAAGVRSTRTKVRVACRMRFPVRHRTYPRTAALTAPVYRQFQTRSWLNSTTRHELVPALHERQPVQGLDVVTDGAERISVRLGALVRHFSALHGGQGAASVLLSGFRSASHEWSEVWLSGSCLTMRCAPLPNSLPNLRAIRAYRPMRLRERAECRHPD